MHEVKQTDLLDRFGGFRSREFRLGNRDLPERPASVRQWLRFGQLHRRVRQPMELLEMLKPSIGVHRHVICLANIPYGIPRT
jgi:hypothetical protein